MTTSGYSGTPLVKKLGIRTGSRIAVIGAPEGFLAETLGLLPDGASVALRCVAGRDVIVLFAPTRAEFERRFDGARRALTPAGGLWIAWPKRASRVETDMTEDVVREVALPTGMVDNKVCAIDETWSGLRLVLRRELRASGPTVK